MGLEVRADAFNAFNHPQLALPNSTLGSPSVGQITNTTNFGGPDRVIQLGGRFRFLSFRHIHHDAEGLAALVRPTPGVAAWNGPYLKGGTVPNDPWNNPYIYRAPGEHGAYDIVSLGSDGQEGGTGTAADISLDTMTSARNN